MHRLFSSWPSFVRPLLSPFSSSWHFLSLSFSFTVCSAFVYISILAIVPHSSPCNCSTFLFSHFSFFIATLSPSSSPLTCLSLSPNDVLFVPFIFPLNASLSIRAETAVRTKETEREESDLPLSLLTCFFSLIFPLYIATPPFLWKRRQRPGRKRPKERSPPDTGRGWAPEIHPRAPVRFTLIRRLRRQRRRVARDRAVANKFSVFPRVFIVGRFVSPKFVFFEERSRAPVARKGNDSLRRHVDVPLNSIIAVML